MILRLPPVLVQTTNLACYLDYIHYTPLYGPSPSAASVSCTSLRRAANGIPGMREAPSSIPQNHYAYQPTYLFQLRTLNPLSQPYFRSGHQRSNAMEYQVFEHVQRYVPRR